MQTIENLEPNNEMWQNINADAFDINKPLTEVRRKIQLRLKLSKNGKYEFFLFKR